MVGYAFNSAQSVELQQAAYEEAARLRELAWERVEVAMFAASPIKVGDKVRIEKQYFAKDNGKVFRVTSTVVRHVTYERGPDRWEVRAKLFPIKKDGGVALTGEHIVDNVAQEFADGKIILVPEIINTK
jgi:hypothetical protein